MKKISGITLLLFCCLTIGISQDVAQFQMGVSPDSVRLGAPFDLQVQLILPANSTVNSVSIPMDSLRSAISNPSDSTFVPYEIINYGAWTAAENNIYFPRHMKWQAQQTTDGKIVFQNILKLIIWEPGVVVLPIAIADISTPQGDYEVFSVQSLAKIILPDENQVSGIDSSGIAPIKPILREAPASIFKKILPFLLVAILLGLLAYYFIKRNKSKELEPFVVPPTPEETALTALQNIENGKDWEQGLLKKYYDELTHVIRGYLEDRFHIKALESTTDEILSDLQKTDIDDSWTSELRKLLPMTDMVKFAKAQPHEEAHTAWLDWSKSLVNSNEVKVIKQGKSSNEMLLPLADSKWKAIAVFDEHLWMSKEMSSSRKILRTSFCIPLEKINRLKQKQADAAVSIIYTSKSGKIIEQAFKFPSAKEGIAFNQQLSKQLRFAVKEEGEVMTYFKKK